MSRTTYKLCQNKRNVLLLSIGGNRKTKQVVELTVVPRYIIDNWSSIAGNYTNSIKKGAAYVKSINTDGRIEDACPSSCVHLKESKCYVQHSGRNASQVSAIIEAIVSQELITLDYLRSVLKTAKLSGITKVRAMVAGDASLIPQNDWKNIERTILKVFPVQQWLAYTHGWKSAPWLKKTHLASVETEEERDEARSLGWNTFYSGDPIPTQLSPGSALCPSSRQFENFKGFKIGCSSCPIGCNGAKPGKKHIVIPRHFVGDNSRHRSVGKKGFKIIDSRGRIRGTY